VFTDFFSNHSLHSDEDIEMIFYEDYLDNKNVDLDRGDGKFSVGIKPLLN